MIFFLNIGPSLAMKIPKQNLNPLQYMGHTVPQTIFSPPVTHAEINQIIMGLKNGAAGYDEITAVTLQLVSLHIIERHMYICNLSLNLGIFPTEMKLANVIPLYKANNAYVFNNYRPVSLLCTLSKVLERVMYSRLIEYLETFKILLDNQFGFRKWHSSYMALMQLTDQLIKSLEKGETVIGVFLDFSKAFDTVDHDILLKKWNIMVLEVVLYIGLKVILQIVNNLSLIMVCLLQLKISDVEYHKGPYYDLCCSSSISMIYIQLVKIQQQYYLLMILIYSKVAQISMRWNVILMMSWETFLHGSKLTSYL